MGGTLERAGTGARSMGMAGASLTNEDDPLATMGQNPGALTLFSRPELQVGAFGAWGVGTYHDSHGRGTDLTDAFGGLPEVAYVAPINDKWGWGLSIIPEDTRRVNWVFRDPAGGADGNTSYGIQDHHSEFLNLRAAAGVAFRITPTLSFGASIGMEYNHDELTSPYTFQSHPALKGMKTLLDLDADGVGINGDVGFHWKATDTVDLALTYRTPTQLTSRGDANGSVTTQLHNLGLAVPGGFHYDAKVETALPQEVAFGASWKVAPNFRLAGQVEWQNWSNAFDTLKVRLSNGSNGVINSVLGSNALPDDVPLDWKDIFVFRGGFEYDLNDSFTFRAGYAYSPNAVPAATLLPMTAAISENTISVGLGYKHGNWRVDVAYQYDLPNTEFATASNIVGSEYKNSSIDVSAHWVGVTVGYKF